MISCTCAILNSQQVRSLAISEDGVQREQLVASQLLESWLPFLSGRGNDLLHLRHLEQPRLEPSFAKVQPEQLDGVVLEEASVVGCAVPDVLRLVTESVEGIQ